MLTAMFVWLGSGRARRNGVGLKGRLLDQAARARLPVPAGAIVLDTFYRFACQKGLVAVRDGRLEIPDPLYFSNTLYHGVRLPRFNRTVIIRPAFSCENSYADDADKRGLRGFSPMVVRPTDVDSQASGPEVALPSHGPATAQIVDSNDLTELALAFGRIWSAAPLDDLWRRDILIMERIQSDSIIGGTAVTTDTGKVDRVSSNIEEAAGAILQLPKLGGWQRPDNTLPPFARRLQQLLRGVRRTFGRGNWMIEWVDDGEICWLVTVYPAEA